MKKIISFLTGLVFYSLIVYFEIGGVYFGFKKSVGHGLLAIALPPYAAYRSYDIFHLSTSDSKISIEKKAFLLSIQLFYEAEMIIDKEAIKSLDNSFPLKKDKKDEVIRLRKGGIESSYLVTDSFFDMIHPELKKYYKECLIDGEQTLLKQLETQDSIVVNSETIRARLLVIEWFQWMHENKVVLDINLEKY